MVKIEKLKDGAQVVIRAIRENDVEGLWAFFCDLPEEDRLCLSSPLKNSLS
jgi:hypothetical protein